MVDSKEERKKRVYILQKGQTKEILSVWSNLSKVYKHLEEKKAEMQVYATIARKIQEDGDYKAIVDNEVYVILVKYVE